MSHEGPRTSAARRVRSRLGRFAVVGLAATALDVGLLLALRHAGMALVPADILAVGVAAAAAYLANRYVSFESDPFVRWVHQPSAFLVVAVLAGAVDVAVLYLTYGLGAPLLVAKLLAVATAAVVRLVAYRWVLLRGVRRRQENRADRPPAPGRATPVGGRPRLRRVGPHRRHDRPPGRGPGRGRAGRRGGDRGGRRRVPRPYGGDGPGRCVPPRRGRRAGRRARGVEVVVLAETPNRGKGAAVRAGMLAARGRTVAFTDADLAYSPDQLLGLLAAIESGWDMVVGSRHHRDATTVSRPGACGRSAAA